MPRLSIGFYLRLEAGETAGLSQSGRHRITARLSPALFFTSHPSVRRCMVSPVADTMLDRVVSGSRNQPYTVRDICGR